MIMEKGMNSGEGLPSRSSQASAAKVTVKELETQQPCKEKRGGFVLVHAGAGYHSESKAKEYKHVCKRACQKAIEKLQAGALATDAVAAALVELEESRIQSQLLTGSCVKGRRASSLQAEFLPGFSLAAFKRNKRKLELAERVETDFIQLKRRRQSSAKENDSGTLDTVGAVVVDHEGNVAAAVSSGGLALKHPGRVGQAALYGCGCWAENTGAQNPYSTAVSTSGCGEHLVRTILARECSHALQAEDAHQALLETMQNKFISSPFLACEDGVLGGVIVLRSCRCSSESDSSQDKQTLLVEFLWSHTTESMCVGYMSAQDGKAKTHISRLPPGAVAGQSVAIEGGVCRLESPVN
ncbi:threonine aspartase 1 isoform X6 [Mus musculus]|uniref:threonine aspartase 1 isoform X6 n=1 Tax=Mus musculus TaxID=10090 RepID=UPI0003D78122|nr:threonine aspartase 1 isoform X6 [Mus musculus]XP_030108034.1 threonine aspartase 1 isoform X6 [Mus musculus]|eukprot:XP_017174801.1 PREDICTED: threonine aspartase 1 isoform X4 [Mus musculus]